MRRPCRLTVICLDPGVGPAGARISTRPMVQGAHAPGRALPGMFSGRVDIAGCADPKTGKGSMDQLEFLDSSVRINSRADAQRGGPALGRHRFPCDSSDHGKTCRPESTRSASGRQARKIANRSLFPWNCRAGFGFVGSGPALACPGKDNSVVRACRFTPDKKNEQSRGYHPAAGTRPSKNHQPMKISCLGISA